jgi:hypothetical protein
VKKYATTRQPFPFAIDDEQFVAYPMPGTALLELAEGDIGEDGSVRINADGGKLVALFAKVMSPDEHARFRAYVDDPAHLVDAQLLGQIIGDIFEASADRPTSPPSASPDGRSNTGTSSTVDSLLQASTPNGSRSLVS